MTPGQARAALGAVIARTLDAPGHVRRRGWLTLGSCGHQPGVAETYISTGSLYLCSAAFLPLGLPATDPFWTDAAARLDGPARLERPADPDRPRDLIAAGLSPHDGPLERGRRAGSQTGLPSTCPTVPRRPPDVLRRGQSSYRFAPRLTRFATMR